MNSIKPHYLLFFAVVSVWAYLLVMPYVPYSQYLVTVYDYRRILTLVLFMVLIFGVALSKQIQGYISQAYNLIPKHIQIMLLVIFLLGSLSAMFNARNTNVAFMQIAYYWMLFILFLFLSGFLIRHKESYKIVIIFAVSMCFAYGCLIAYRYIQVLIIHINHPRVTLQNIDRNIVFPNFMNVRFLNQYISWILPIVTLAIFVFKRTYLKVFAIIVTILLWYIVIASKSRVYILEYFLLLPLILYIDRKNAIRYIGISLLTLFLGWCVFEILNYSLGTAGGSVLQREISDENGRFILWSLAFNGFLSHPLLGIGAFQYPGYIFDVTRIVSHPHSFYLQVLCEWGIVVFGIILYMIITTAVRYVNKTKIEKSMQHLLILAAVLCGLVHAELSGVFVMPLSQYTAIIVFAVAYSFYHNQIEVNESQTSLLTLKTIHIYIITFIAGFILINTSFKQMKNYPVYIHNYFVTCPNMMYNPNFWSIGWENIYPNLQEGTPFRCHPHGSVGK